MMRLAALLLGLLAAPAAATTVQPYMGAYPDTVAGIEYANLSGRYCIAASSKTPTACLVIIDGRYGWVAGSSAAWVYGMTAATGTFTGTGDGRLRPDTLQRLIHQRGRGDGTLVPRSPGGKRDRQRQR
jgi:hypothetical protein